ncbi:MAG: heparinase II/III family protein [Acidobacteriota bacterium]|nr:heparinase II/III family protein [Acidobacteriota bacterium]
MTKDQGSDALTGPRTDAGRSPTANSRRSLPTRLSFLNEGIRAVLRGEIGPRKAGLELFRRARALVTRRRERNLQNSAAKPARLLAEFQQLSPAELLKHFQSADRGSFFPGFDDTNKSTATEQQKLFPEETARLIESAQLIAQEHRWPLLGFGEKNFGPAINWLRDPLSGRIWPTDFHADIPLWHNDGSDIRVEWELNRLGHFLTLGRAYVMTGDEQLAEEFFAQTERWRGQNPPGHGPNWSCAMEVALRAMNLLGAFSLFRQSPGFTAERLAAFLTLLDQHGVHIRRNLEFSYLATSNHYLSDIVGLLWIGIALPELSAAKEWREWALVEMVCEMDKQILDDGADYEASTGYHRFVLELFLYSFVLCRANNIEIEEKYWRKLHAMLVYLRGYLRPDGLAPLIGDTDGGQVLPLVSRAADEHAYLLPLGAVLFREPRFKLPVQPASEELLWIMGEKGMREYESMNANPESLQSQAFPEAGTFVLRRGDLFLLFNASGAGGKGRGSHGHNDALSVEVSACGCPFIVDPGTYVYTADLHERELFRSTGYHSTIQLDGVEQNTTRESVPFVIGDEAHPEVLLWETGPESDHVIAEHAGYQRLANGVRHRRSLKFFKKDRWWLIEDELLGKGEHAIEARFHFNASLDIAIDSEGLVSARDKTTGSKLLVRAIGLSQQPVLERIFSSRHYGSKSPSVSACWTLERSAPTKLLWALVPVCGGENLQERMNVVQSPMSNVQSPLSS